MKYLYDLFARIIKKRKTAKLVYKFVSVFLYLALTAAVTVLLVIRIKKTGLDMTCGMYFVCIVFLMSCLIEELFFKIRYLHVSHNKEIKRVAREAGVKPVIRNPHGKDIFSCTFDNDAFIECTYEKNKYHFSVKNDEWDEIANYQSGEDDFEDVLREAAVFTASIEKKPGGEYDESLMPEEDGEEYGEEYGEEEPDEDENGSDDTDKSGS